MGANEPDELRDDVPWGRMVSNFKELVSILENRNYAEIELQSRLALV